MLLCRWEDPLLPWACGSWRDEHHLGHHWRDKAVLPQWYPAFRSHFCPCSSLFFLRDMFWVCCKGQQARRQHGLASSRSPVFQEKQRLLEPVITPANISQLLSLCQALAYWFTVISFLILLADCELCKRTCLLRQEGGVRAKLLVWWHKNMCWKESQPKAPWHH